jgi:hypothetical protein
MLSHVPRRVAALSAVALCAFFAGSPTAFAGTPDRGASAEHRSDSSIHDDADPTEPQPASNADFTGNGANDTGAYDSTRDGSPSENGNGDGAATGEPCAGCVGQADNKNPPGQAPDGSDANNGYECDGNRGIGQTNPAHTGCVEDETPLTPEKPEIPETPLTSLRISSVEVSAAAHETTVLGVSFTRPAAEVLAATTATPAGAVSPAAALATTGARVSTLAMFGLALLLGGALVLAGSRRKTHS